MRDEELTTAWAVAGKALAQRDQLLEDAVKIRDALARVTAERDEARRSAGEHEKDVVNLLKRVDEERSENRRARVLIGRIASERCHADSDGDCGWNGCPQNKPETRLTWCPFARDEEEH